MSGSPKLCADEIASYPRTIERRAHELALLARSSAVVGVPFAVGMMLSFLASIAMARWLGGAEFGSYSYVLLWVPVLSALSVFGLDNVALREIATCGLRQEWAAIRAFVGWSRTIVVSASIALGTTLVLTMHYLHGGARDMPVMVWLLAAVLLLAAALGQLQQMILRALHRRALSQWAGVVQPMLLLPMILAAAASAGSDPAATTALGMQAVAALSMVMVGAGLVRRALPRASRVAASPDQRRRWMGSASWMSLLAALVILSARVDGMMLGLLAGPASVGPYSAAMKGAGLVPLVFTVVVVTVSPSFAVLHAGGDRVALLRLARRVAQLALLGAVPVAAALSLAGRQFLGLFGDGFQSAQPALLILSLGQLVNVAMGPVAALLLLTGHEREVVVGVGASTVVNIAICAALIPRLGMTGAAAGSGAALVAWNAVLRWFVQRRLTTWSEER